MYRPHHGVSRSALLATVVASLFFVLPAVASGAKAGLKPSTAPAAVVGKHYFGNFEDGYHRAFWKIPPLLAQDIVTVAWNDPNRDSWLCIAVDIDDYNWAKSEFACNGSNLSEVEANGSTRDTLKVRKTSSQAYFTFRHGCCGDPYDFVIESIQHTIGVDINKIVRMRPKQVLRGSAVLSDGSAVPDGLSFTLTATWQNARDVKQSIRVDAESQGGELAFPVSLPKSARGRKIAAQVSRPADEQYLEASSPTLDIQVVKPHPPAAFLRCRRQTFRKLFRSIRTAKHRYRGRVRRRKIKRAYHKKTRQMNYCRAKHTTKGQRRARRRAARRRSQQAG